MKSYLIMWDGGQATRIDLRVAMQLADENKGMVYIADGSYTQEIAGVKIYDYSDKNED